MKIILPFELNVPIDAFNYNISELGIILTDCEAIKYIYNENINLYNFNASTYIETGFTYRKPVMSSTIDTPILEMKIGLNRHLDIDRKELFEYFKYLIISLISSDYYIIGVWDEFYIKDRYAYNESHFLHDWFAYGCDDDCVHIAGYDNTGKPAISYVPYDVLFESVYSQSITQDHIYIYKHNTEYKYEIDYNLIQMSLNDYITSTSFEVEENCTYGISVVDDILKFSSQTGCFDMRSMRTLLNQKKLLIDRYRYLTSDTNNELSSELTKNNELMNLAFMNSLKYNYTQSQHDFDIVYNYLNEITEKEKILLPNYLSFV